MFFHYLFSAISSVGSFFWQSTAAAEEETFARANLKTWSKKRKSRFTAADQLNRWFHWNELQQSNIRETIAACLSACTSDLSYVSDVELGRREAANSFGAKTATRAVRLLSNDILFGIHMWQFFAPLFSWMCVICMRVTCVSVCCRNIWMRAFTANPQTQSRINVIKLNGFFLIGRVAARPDDFNHTELA